MLLIQGISINNKRNEFPFFENLELARKNQLLERRRRTRFILLVMREMKVKICVMKCLMTKMKSIFHYFSEKLEDWDVLKKGIIVWDEREKVRDSPKVPTMFCSRKSSPNCKCYLEFRRSKETKDSHELPTYENGHNHELIVYDAVKSITFEMIQSLTEIMEPLQTLQQSPETLRNILSFTKQSITRRINQMRTNLIERSQAAHNFCSKRMLN